MESNRPNFPMYERVAHPDQGRGTGLLDFLITGCIRQGVVHIRRSGSLRRHAEASAVGSPNEGVGVLSIESPVMQSCLTHNTRLIPHPEEPTYPKGWQRHLHGSREQLPQMWAMVLGLIKISWEPGPHTSGLKASGLIPHESR